MKAKLLFTVGAVAMTVASISAQAQVPITGQINFVGGATIDNPIPTATTFTSFFGPGPLGGPVVSVGGGYPDGSYTGVPATVAVNFAPSFDFASLTSPFQLWSFNALGQTYSFQVNTVTTQQQATSPFNYIDITGTGTGTITGGAYLPTPETWSISGFDLVGGLTVTIGEQNVAVPEPATLAFGGLGGLLSIVTLIRRK
jgi:hypothetical protein